MPEYVTTGGGYIRYIKSKTQLLLTEAEVQQVIQQIAAGRLKPSIKTHIQHAQHVGEILSAKSAPAAPVSPPSSAPVSASTKNEVEPLPASKACPQCGSDMVLRKAKKGAQAGKQFWGCSAFPKCQKIAALE